MREERKCEMRKREREREIVKGVMGGERRETDRKKREGED